MNAARLEVHGHCDLSRPQAGSFEHSHADGSGTHLHPHTGPAAFTIDKDEWLALTGCRGGGRKKYTAKPRGPQLEWVAPEHTTFKVVFGDHYTPEHERSGITREQHEAAAADFRAAVAAQEARRAVVKESGEPSGLAVANLACSFNLEPIYVYEDHRPAKTG